MLRIFVWSILLLRIVLQVHTYTCIIIYNLLCYIEYTIQYGQNNPSFFVYRALLGSSISASTSYAKSKTLVCGCVKEARLFITCPLSVKRVFLPYYFYLKAHVLAAFKVLYNGLACIAI